MILVQFYLSLYSMHPVSISDNVLRNAFYIQICMLMIFKLFTDSLQLHTPFWVCLAVGQEHISLTCILYYYDN